MNKLKIIALAFLLSTPTSIFAQGMQVFSNTTGGSGAGVAGNNDFTGNNSFLDTKFTIKNTSDTTKAFQFLASGITAGQTRIITIPNFDATMATLAGTESLSNKTLPSFELGAAATDTTIARAAAGQVSVEGNIVPVIAAAGSLTSGRIPFAGANNTISDDSDLSFSTDTLTATKIIGSTSITNSSLTSGRVIFSGSSGIQSDDADLTFSTDTLTTTKLASTIETGTLSVGTAAGAANAVELGETAGQITFEGSTSDAIETRLAVADPTDADKTITLPNVTGTVPLVICKSAPNQATTGTTEEVLGTCTIPANTLSADGDTILLGFSGVSAANGNNKTLRVRFGGISGVIMFDMTAAASNNQFWGSPYMNNIVRTSSTTIRSAFNIIRAAKGGTASSTAMTWFEDSETVDFTISNTLVITAITPSASGDFTLNTFWAAVVK